MDGEVLGTQVMSCRCCSAGMEWEGCDRQPEPQVTQIFSSAATGRSLTMVQINLLRGFVCSSNVHFLHPFAAVYPITSFPYK